MKIYITGANGYVGKALVKAGAIPLLCDVSNYDEVYAEFESVKPPIVLHLASKSGVNWCEKNVREAYTANITGTMNVMTALSQLRLPGVLLSSDQIWSGKMFGGRYTEQSKPTPPVNIYGMTKVSAEFFTLESGQKIIRTSFLFNYARLKTKIVDIFNGKSITEPVFIRRSFMHLDYFIESLLFYCSNFYRMPSVLHISGTDVTDWHKFMRMTAETIGANPRLVKARFWEISGEAPRPHNGGLNTFLSRKLGFRQYSLHESVNRLANEVENV